MVWKFTNGDMIGSGTRGDVCEPKWLDVLVTSYTYGHCDQAVDRVTYYDRSRQIGDDVEKAG